jgi:hypothetical protein
MNSLKPARFRWALIEIVSITLLAGCQAPTAPFDPFLAGQTTIPPPATALPAGASPYYNVAPPVVTVPGAAPIPAPSVAPAPAIVPPPASSLPPAGSPRFPRGISVPTSSTQSPRAAVAVASSRWQPADAMITSLAAEPTGAVVRVSHTETAKEPPLRIVER